MSGKRTGRWQRLDRMTRLALFFVFAALAVGCARAQDPAPPALPGFATDTARRIIPLNELQRGGPGKDGIPALGLDGRAPATVSQDAATAWLADREPVILVRHNGEARIYPVQILIWHEIANDTLGGAPLAVTFCPLCYSAVVLDRRLPGRDAPLTLGVSGLLRHSDMVIYDRQTETLWQQFTGEALVGELVGTTLTTVPAQIVSFAQARADAPDALVLSRETGFRRDYGRNPYVGYDDVDKTPLFYRGREAEAVGLRPMARIVAVEVDGPAFRAYPADATRAAGALNDTLAGTPLVVFHADGAATALGDAAIASGRDVGATGAFDRRLTHDGVGYSLTFRADGDAIADAETGSTWSVAGLATSGPLAGARLTPLQSHDTFAFAWLAFRPETTVWRAD